MSAKFPRGGGGIGPFLARSLYRLSLVIVPKYHMLARMAPGLRLQLDPYCRASFDSKSFAKVDVTDGQRDESRALPVLLHKTCASYCHIVVVVVSGIIA